MAASDCHDRRSRVRDAYPTATGRSHDLGFVVVVVVVVVVVIVVGLFDYDNDNDSVPGISVTTSVLIAPRGADHNAGVVTPLQRL